jgi:hypothetical protein
MEGSLWRTTQNEWAVCEGDGPLCVAGYLQETARGWAIKDDPQNRIFLNSASAATVLSRGFPDGVRYYLLGTPDGNRTVLTYPDVLERIVAAEGWTLIGSARTLAELEV